MSGEPWDELMGPSRKDLDNILDEGDIPHILKRQQSAPAAPPAPPSTALSKSTFSSDHRASSFAATGVPPASGSAALAASGSSSSSSSSSSSGTAYMSSIPDRWSQYERDDDRMKKEIGDANYKAITLAAERSFQERIHNGGGVESHLAHHGFENELASDQQEENIPTPSSKKWTDRMKRYTIDDEDEEDDALSSTVVDAALMRQSVDSIRAEAVKMLKKADQSLTTNPSSVRRTQTGGYSATIDSSPYSTRTRTSHVPAALSGLNLQSPIVSSKSTTPPAPDSSPDGTVSTAASTPAKSPSSSRALEITRQYDASPPKRSDLHQDIEKIIQGEDDNIDVVPTSRSSPSASWSSRYSIDQTLMALTGGRKSPRDILNEFENEDNGAGYGIKGAARDLFWGSAHQPDVAVHDDPPSSGGIFGSGFSFRQKHVFGKQNVVYDTKYKDHVDEPNLQTVWMDLDKSGQCSLPPAEPRKTWQEQMEYKKRQRRRLVLLLLACILIVATVITSVVASRKNPSKARTNSATKTDAALLSVGDQVTFYVTSNVPFDSSQEGKLSQDLTSLATLKGEFLVHLGNIQDSSVTLCSRTKYPSTKAVLLDSPVPVFILPGEEDWNNCPNPLHAWDLWQENFSIFESNFHHKFRVNHQKHRPENFGFVHNHVLFIGFHLVGGRIDDPKEWNARHDDDVAWLESMVTLTREDFRAIVMFGNARPSPQHHTFFDRLKNYIGEEIPAIYIHANSGVGGVMQYSMFDDDGQDSDSNSSGGIQALQIGDGGKSSPLRVSVGHGSKPFVFG